MAITWDFGYTNKSNMTSPTPIDHKKLQITENYALKVDEPDECQLSNTTAPIDQPEVITYQAAPVKNIPTKIKVSNPLPARDGIMYGVRIDTVLRGQSDTDDSYVVDLPIVCNISFKHPVNNAITMGTIQDVFARAVAALYTEQNKPRFRDLMMSALKPTED